MILPNICRWRGEVTNEGCVGLNFKLMTHKFLKSYFSSDPISYVPLLHHSLESESMKYVCKNIKFDLTQTVFQMSHSKIGQEITLIIPKSLLFQTSCQVYSVLIISVSTFFGPSHATQ